MCLDPHLNLELDWSRETDLSPRDCNIRYIMANKQQTDILVQKLYLVSPFTIVINRMLIYGV